MPLTLADRVNNAYETLQSARVALSNLATFAPAPGPLSDAAIIARAHVAAALRNLAEADELAAAQD